MNKHLKKVLSITFVFVLAFVLIACNNGASNADKEAVEAAKLDVTIGKIIGTNASKDEIKEDLVLPLKSGEVVVSWSSDKKEIITDAGKVERPEEEDVTVTLTASFKLNDAEDTKTFEVKVLKTAGGSLPVDPTDFDFHETFDTASLTTSYADGNFTGVGGIVWTYTHSRDEDTFAIDGKGIMLRRALDSHLEVTLPDGVGAFSFEYRKAFTGGNERQLEIIVNGTQVVTSDPFGSGSGEQATVYTLTHNINTAGPVTIRIKNVGDGDFNRQIIIDNIKWSNFS